MDFQTIFIFIFIYLLTLIKIKKKKKIQIQKIIFPLLYIILYRTKLGLKFMDNTATKFPRFLKYLGYTGIGIGFLGMILIAFSLIDNLIKTIITPSAIGGVALVLPFKVKGSFYVPFFYWIISIFILAVIHEASHGILARVHNIKLKSSGFAFLSVLVPVIPAAFVEPDEKKVSKSSVKKQLSIFAAGPFSNIITAFACLLILLFLFAPIANSIVYFEGVRIGNIIEDYPAKKAGIAAGEIIEEIDNIKTDYVENFTDILDRKKPGENILVKTDKNEYNITLAKSPNNDSLSYLGVYVEQEKKIKDSVKEKYSVLPDIFMWIAGLFYWLYILNLGIGLFNLVPAGPLDGGRMLKAFLFKKFREKTAGKLFFIISYFFLILIIANLISAFF